MTITNLSVFIVEIQLKMEGVVSFAMPVFQLSYCTGAGTFF